MLRAVFGSIVFVCLAVTPFLTEGRAESTTPDEASLLGLDFKGALAAAKQAEEEGKLARAEYLYRKLNFAKPRHSKSRKGLRNVTRARAKQLIDRAEKNISEDPYFATIDLQMAYGLDPKEPRLEALFTKLGHELYQGEWLTKSRVEQLAELTAHQGAGRRSQLGLAEDFTVIIQGPFKFLTNVDTRGAKSVLQQALHTNHSHYKKYREVMGPLRLRHASEGVDVVLFDNREQYVRYTKHSGSAGLYVPARAAGFFFRDGSFNFPTMLHEMTHQLNDKLLNINSHAWFEEGISEYFGAGFVTQGGKRIEVGRPDGGRMASFQKAVKGISGYYIALDRFCRMGQAELTDEFYSQSWALTHFLMEVHPKGRLILFDYMAGRSPVGQIVDRQGEDLLQILEAYGISLETFEAELKDFYKTGKYSPRT
ncbi:MAG: DUF1570 domain-containing protein [Planctomycetota bacterium]